MLLITGGVAGGACRAPHHCPAQVSGWFTPPVPHPGSSPHCPPALPNPRHCCQAVLIPVLPVWSDPQRQHCAHCGGSVGVTWQVCPSTHGPVGGGGWTGCPPCPSAQPLPQRVRQETPTAAAAPRAPGTPVGPAHAHGAGHGTPRRRHAWGCTSILARPALAHPPAEPCTPQTHPDSPQSLPALPSLQTRGGIPCVPVNSTAEGGGCALCASEDPPAPSWRGVHPPSSRAPWNPSGCTRRWLRARDGAGAAVPDAGWATRCRVSLARFGNTASAAAGSRVGASPGPRVGLQTAPPPSGCGAPAKAGAPMGALWVSLRVQQPPKG